MKKVISWFIEPSAMYIYSILTVLFAHYSIGLGVILSSVGLVCAIVLYIRRAAPIQNKEFLEKYPLEFAFKSSETEKLDAVRSVLKDLNTSYIIEYTEEISGSYTYFTAYIPTTNFAIGYYMIGIRMQEKVFSKTWKD